MPEAGIIEDDAPFSGRLPRCVASIAVHDPRKSGDPGHSIVPYIPDQGERAVWLQNAKNLVRRLLIVEPMEGGRATDEVRDMIETGMNSALPMSTSTVARRSTRM